MAPVRPPKDITPKSFFESWLPEQLASASGFKPMTIRVRLDGDGGGAWDLVVGEQGLRVGGADGAAEPEVTVAQSVADWKAIAIGEPGAVDLAPPQSSATDILFLDKQAQSMLGQVKGQVRFEVTGYNGRTWQLTVKFGDAPMKPEPDSTISVDAETYGQILARTLPPPQAYFQGKVRMTGDMNLAMQLGMAMMPRFS